MAVPKHAIAAGLVAIFVSSCASGPSIQTGPDAETSFDGLVRVDGSGFSDAWARPGVPLSNYSELILPEPELEFRPTQSGQDGRSPVLSVNLSPADRGDLARAVQEAFQEELAKSRYFTVTDVPGPEVLVVDIRIIDIVARAPAPPLDPSEVADPGLGATGGATLVLEAHDSLTGAILYRAVQRQVGRATVGGALASREANWPEMRRTARRWGESIRNQLDQAHDI